MPANETRHVTGKETQLLPMRLTDTRRAAGDGAALMLAAVEAQTALREAATAAAEAAERAQSMAAVLDEALENLGSFEAMGGSRLSAPPMPTLSPREREVLALVTEGRSNKAIAAELFVSPNTVKSHVASLLSKWHAESRAQLAAMAASRAIVRR